MFGLLDGINGVKTNSPFDSLRNAMLTFKSPETARTVPLDQFPQIAAISERAKARDFTLYQSMADELLARASARILPLKIALNADQSKIEVNIADPDANYIEAFLKFLAKLDPDITQQIKEMDAAFEDARPTDNQVWLQMVAKHARLQSSLSTEVRAQLEAIIATTGLAEQIKMIANNQVRIRNFTDKMATPEFWNSPAIINFIQSLQQNCTVERVQIQKIRTSLVGDDPRIPVTEALQSLLSTLWTKLNESLIERRTSLIEKSKQPDDDSFSSVLLRFKTKKLASQVPLQQFPVLLKRFHQYGYLHSGTKELMGKMCEELISRVSSEKISISTRVDQDSNGLYYHIRSTTPVISKPELTQIVEFFGLVQQVCGKTEKKYADQFNKQVRDLNNQQFCRDLQRDVRTQTDEGIQLSTKIDLFKKIYTALRDGQSGIFKSSFHLELDEHKISFPKELHVCVPSIDPAIQACYQDLDKARTRLLYLQKCVSLVENYSRAHPSSRTAAAWRLANTNLGKEALITAIYKESFARSGFFKKSHAFGSTFYRTSALSSQPAARTAEEINNAAIGTRTYKIAMALR